MRVRRVRRTIEWVGVALAAAISGCATPPPDLGEAIPDPEQPLRPQDLRGAMPAESRIVDYEIEARYDEEDHMITGRARITWKNRSGHTVDALPFHLYMNGFRAEDTAWMRQARGSHRSNGQDRENPWGYMDVASVQRLGGAGADGTPAKTPLAHRESDEPSLMQVPLDEPLPSGGQVELEIEFTTKLPKVFARTGFADRYVMAGQWFPKPGVLLPDGTWHAHPFTLYSEFFADFGNYEVYLDVPSDLVVGASGVRVSHEEEGSRQRLHYRAHMVHDFAWTAGPDLVEAYDDYEGIRIRALLPTDRAADAPKHLDAQRAALKSMEARFGPYPWSTITFIDPPKGAEGAGGMEYPTFYTTSPASKVPDFARSLGFDVRVGGEFTTIHEFGHQYFQGLLASNEFRQPWLDEGLNTFSNMLVYIDWYGPDDKNGPWLVKAAGHPVTMYDGLRLTVGSDHIQPVDQPADHFTPLVGVYGSVTYQKTAATMLTLRRVLGGPRFDAAMRGYADRFRFRHPTGQDLADAFVDRLGANVALGTTADGRSIDLSIPEFFDQALRGTETLDFAVRTIKVRRKLGNDGWQRDEHGELVGGGPRPEPEESLDDVDVEELESVVVVHRRGGFMIPVEIEVEFEDGETDRVIWDGRGRYRVLQWPARRVRSVSIDPDRRLVLESRRWNNTRFVRRRLPPAQVSEAVGALSESAALAVLGGIGP